MIGYFFRRKTLKFKNVIMVVFSSEILVFGLYRKVWDWSRSISSNVHRNRTAGDLVNTQKRGCPICFVILLHPVRSFEVFLKSLCPLWSVRGPS